LDAEYKRAQIANLTDKGKGATPMTPEERQRWGIPDDDKRPWMLVDGKPEPVGGANAPGGAGQTKKGLTPILMKRKDGSLYYAQADDAGNITKSTVEEGSTPVDPMDRSYSQSYGRELGEAEAQRRAMAAQQLESAVQAQDLIAQIKTNSYIDRGTGMSSSFNSVPGTGGYDFQNLVDQAKSGAFLTAIPQLKGFGALSNTEGAAATAAIARMDTATSKEAFLKAVDDYEKIVSRGLEKADEIIRSGQPILPSMRDAPADSDGWTVRNGVKIRKKAP